MSQVGIRSLLPGRVRFEIPVLLDRPDLCGWLDHELLSVPGVSTVSSNPITGRLLLTHSPQLSLDRFHDRLVEALAVAHSGRITGRGQPSAPGEKRSTKLSGISGAREFLSVFHNHEKQAALALLVAFVDRLFEAAPPAMIGAATDVVMRGPRSFLARLGFRSITSQLAALGGMFALLWMADALMGFLHGLSSARLAQSVQRDLRDQLYQHLQTLDPGQIEGKAVTTWLGYLQADVGRVGQFIETGLDPAITILTNSGIVLATLLANAPGLFLVQLALLPPLYFVSDWLLGPLKSRREVEREVADRMAKVLHSNISGAPMIRVFGTEQLEAQRVAAIGEELEHASWERALTTSAYVPAIQMVVGVGFIGTLLWGGRLVNQGSLSVAIFNVMGFTSLRLMVAFGSLGSALQQYQQMLVSIERINRVLNQRPRVAGGTRLLEAARKKEIVFENVGFEYEKDRPVLRGLNLRFAAGGTTGIVGATGAGKTTILKLILRFYDVNSGVIRVDGIPVRDIAADNLRRQMSLVPQQIFLFAGAIRENIAYGRPAASMDDIVKAAEVAQAHEFISALPDGYDTLVGAGGVQLSGGQQQRIAIARAILADRAVLLFDEATSAIDYETESAIQNALREVIEDRTTIIVAHRLSTVRHADLIYVLDEGRVCEQGRHDELIRMQGVYANLWRIQTGEVSELSKSRRRRAGTREEPPPA